MRCLAKRQKWGEFLNDRFPLECWTCSTCVNTNQQNEVTKDITRTELTNYANSTRPVKVKRTNSSNLIFSCNSGQVIIQTKYLLERRSTGTNQIALSQLRRSKVFGNFNNFPEVEGRRQPSKFLIFLSTEIDTGRK